VKLFALSDLHLGHEANRDALTRLGSHPDDWLVLAGDIGEWPSHLEYALEQCVPRFRQVVWTPGNHDLWCPPEVPRTERGEARYQALVEICRRAGVLTPDDPYLEWPDGSNTFIVPMFLLYDYTFRPADVPVERAVAWARETGVVCSDERLLDPEPFASRTAWCHARCTATERRLDELPASARTVLINHWPLRHDLARPPRIPRFSVWCGTMLTENWAERFRARAVVSGHLHLRTTLWRQGIRYDEVSLGYLRDWRQERGIDWYLREILPGTSTESTRFVPPRDPFR